MSDLMIIHLFHAESNLVPAIDESIECLQSTFNEVLAY